MDKFAMHQLKLAAEAVTVIEQGCNKLKENLLVLAGYFDDGFSSEEKMELELLSNKESNVAE